HFQGVLRVAGHAFSPSAEVTAIELRLGNGECAALQGIGLPSVDLAGRYGRAALACRFDDTLVVGDDVASVLGASLRVQLSDGREHVLRDLGEGHGDDRTYRLWERFKTMVQAQPTGHLLEVGSRARVGVVRREWLPEGWDYTGMDVVPGP